MSTQQFLYICCPYFSKQPVSGQSCATVLFILAQPEDFAGQHCEGAAVDPPAPG